MGKYLLTRVSKKLEALTNNSIGGITVLGVRPGWVDDEVNWIEIKFGELFNLEMTDEGINKYNPSFRPDLVKISVEYIDNKYFNEEFAYEQAKVVYNILRSEVLPEEFDGLEISRFYKEGANDISV